MHLRPVKYTAFAGGQPGLASRQPSMRLPATLLDDAGNNNNSNPLFTVKQYYSSLQQSSATSAEPPGSQAGNAMAKIKSSREISALTSFPIKHSNNTNYNNNSSSRGGFSSAFLAANGATNETNFQDKMKLMEISIINLVELSCLAADENKFELALIKSKEALDGLASLRSLVLQRQSLEGNQSEYIDRQPVTRGARFVELALMVNCNLAKQLMNSGHLEQSLELYTQITKLAGASGSANQSTSLLLIGGQQLYGDSKFLLYRFGMNIGNVLYRMGDYQRALKYYRLTLDRLSSSSQTSLRIKLMNNISLSLLALKQENEAITSMNRLLDENLSHSMQLINDNRSQTKREQQTNEGNCSSVGPCNSNHQRFALNLIVCYYQRHDSASIMATLKALIKADICHQYERVLDCSKLARQRRLRRVSSNGEQFRYDNGAPMSDLLNETSSAGFAKAELHLLASTTSPANAELHQSLHNFQQFGASASNPNNGKRHVSTYAARRESLAGRDPMIDSGAHPTAIQSPSRAAGHEHRHEPTAAASKGLMKPSNVEKFGQVMNCIQGDRLEMLIGEKEKQIVRLIMLACNLLLDLDRTNNESIKISFSDQATKPASTRLNQRWTDQRLATSAFDFCLNLLSTSPTYKSLVTDLKVDRMNGMLGKRYKLDEAVALFKEIGTHDLADHDRDQWRAVSEQQRAVSGGGGQSIPTPDRLRGNHLLARKIKYNASETTPSQRSPLRSSAMAINKTLVHLLRKCYAKAVEEAEEIPALNGADLARALVNHANCLFNMNRLAEADSLYQRAIKIEPNCWEAHYNLVIVSRKLERNYDQLDSSSKSHLAKDRQILGSSLLNRSMILSTIQSALIYMQSGNEKQAITIFNDLVINSRQAPEVHLLISKLVSEESSSEDGRSPAQIVLHQAHRENPYHLPVLERLIALKIRAFDYDSAKQLLVHCIKNRPNQVKWYQMLAECHRRAAEYKKAIVVYKTAIVTFPQDTSCLRALIKLTDELGMAEERRIYEKKLDRALKNKTSA